MQYPTVVIAGLLGLILAAPAQADDAKPKLMRKGDLAGKMLEGPDVYESTEDGNTTLDATSFMSSDERFGSGMYRSGPVRYEVDEPYGVDEFMYFIEGGVTLTSSDGTVQVVKAGEAVTVPKEWTGIWETKGYTKIWVIYSEDGSGLE
ncbi:MAG: cupin domain-containing protein [Pseudomonadota bacterium]